jgi:hypothetical protein
VNCENKWGRMIRAVALVVISGLESGERASESKKMKE